jgi:dephospho-CoA kinase
MTGHRRLLIGITGNIGTGKSAVAGMLSELGAKVIDADKVAHEVMRSGTCVHARIVKAFGQEIVASDGEIHRGRLGAIVFADPAQLAILESIVHPVTVEAIGERIAAVDAGVIVVEAIKLIESGMADACDSVWVTTCRPEQQICRIVARGLNRADAEQRVRAQPPQDDKVARADVVIDNSGSLCQTRRQVEAAWAGLVGGEGTGGEDRGAN